MNPIDSYSKDISQWELESAADEGYEDTLRAFEISQLKQKQRKPRRSNFFPFKSRVSIINPGAQMNVIHEDDKSSKSQDEEAEPKSSSRLARMESIQEEK